MASSKRTLDITYVKSNNYCMYPATGAWGGASPQGEIVCNFFVEHQYLPVGVTVEIDDTGKGNENISPANIDKFIREIQTTIVMRPDIAKMIGEWLIHNADDIIKQMKPK